MSDNGTGTRPLVPPGGRPKTDPPSALLTFMDQVIVWAVSIFLVGTVLLYTPLGRHWFLAKLLPLSVVRQAWASAGTVAILMWLLGFLPRRLARKSWPIDDAVLALLRFLWQRIPTVRPRSQKSPSTPQWTTASSLGRPAPMGLSGYPASPSEQPPAGGMMSNRGTDSDIPTSAVGTGHPSDASSSAGYPPITLLTPPSDVTANATPQAEHVVQALSALGFAGLESVDEILGPTVAAVTVQLPPHLAATKVMAAADDLTVALGTESVAIRPAGQPGALLVEIPLRERTIVPLRSLLATSAFVDLARAGQLPIAMGIDTAVAPVVFDLARAPHMLVAGATQTGKSIFLHDLLLSLLFTRTPDECGIILVDPKRVEFGLYRGLPHLLVPPIEDMDLVPDLLTWLVEEQETRYKVFSQAGKRNIQLYNKSALQSGQKPLSYLVLLIDELADLVQRKKGPGVETLLQLLAQKARAAGIHLVLGTQRPSVQVIPGDLKANLDARVGFRVVTEVDSRVILDRGGAEKLSGLGDMFFSSGGALLRRLQAPYVQDEEVERVVAWWQGAWTSSSERTLSVPPPQLTGGKRMVVSLEGPPTPTKVEMSPAHEHKEEEDVDSSLDEHLRQGEIFLLQYGHVAAQPLRQHLRCRMERALEVQRYFYSQNLLAPRIGGPHRTVCALTEEERRQRLAVLLECSPDDVVLFDPDDE